MYDTHPSEYLKLQFVSYFYMLGTLESGGLRKDHYSLVDNFFEDLGLPASNIFVVGPKPKEEFRDLQIMKGCNYIATDDEKYSEWYKWSYGEPYLKGQGVTYLYVKDPHDGTSIEKVLSGIALGNIIEIYDSFLDKKFVEIAFGMSCLEMASEGRDSSVECFPMAGILGKVSERANGYHSLEVFVDCLYTSLALILQDVQLSQTKDGHLLKRYLKLVLIHCERIGLDQSDLYPLLQSAIEGLCENSDVQQIISLYQLNLSNVKASMDQNRANFLKFRKRNSAMKREDLLNIAVSRFGILPIEAADWLEQVY
jgi:hypothetical protein